MNTPTCLQSSLKLTVFGVLILILGVFAPAAPAQTARIEDRLPPDTILFIKWNGSTSLKGAQSKNHLLQLLADPDFAPAEIAAAAYLGKSLAKEKEKNAGPQLPELISLLDNQMVVGFVMPSNAAAGSNGAATKSPGGFFFVYDTTGKKELLQKLNAESKTKNTGSSKYSKYEFGGVSVDVQEKPAEKDYSAYVGTYYVNSNRKDVAEDLITRYGGNNAPATSLIHRAQYQETRKYVDAGACIEMFGWMPDIAKMIPDDPKNPTTGKIVQGLHLEKIHAFTFTVDLSGEATRTRGALLGDASPGTIFDFAGASAATFQTMPTVGSGASFQISRINFAGLYNYVVGAVQGNLPPQQDASLKATQGMAQGYLGMSLGDALGLFSGEFLQVSYYSQDGSTDKLYAMTIEKPEDVLRILRTMAGSFILSEDTSGSATFLDFTYPYKDPVSGTDRRKFFYLAVTPHMVLAAPRKAMIREAISRISAANQTAPAAGVLAAPEYARMRSALPANLSGLAAMDFRQIPLDKILATYLNQMEEARKQSKSNEPVPDFGWLKQMKTDVLTRHLHLSVGGWWKDSNGVYFDSSFE